MDSVRRFSTYHLVHSSGISPDIGEYFVECEGVDVPVTVRHFALLLKNLRIFQPGMRIVVRHDEAMGLCQLLGHRDVHPDDFGTKSFSRQCYFFGGI